VFGAGNIINHQHGQIVEDKPIETPPSPGSNPFGRGPRGRGREIKVKPKYSSDDKMDLTSWIIIWLMAAIVIIGGVVMEGI
jgi:hypothetical protein